MAEATGQPGAGDDKEFEHPQWVIDAGEAVTKQGFVDLGDGNEFAVRVVPKSEGFSARVEKLVAGGTPEEEARNQVHADIIREVEGGKEDYASIGDYVRDQVKKNEGLRIVVDDSNREMISRVLKRPGDFINLSVWEGEIVGVTYLSKDGSLRYIAFPDDVVTIGGKELRSRSNFMGLLNTELRFVEAEYAGENTHNMVSWLQTQLKNSCEATKEAAKAKAQVKRKEEFEF